MPRTLPEPPSSFYAKEYQEYWSREDRWGTDSFEDAAAIAASVLETCGPGPVLDVGCGMGRLVRALLKRGVDAHGLDVTVRTVEHGNAAHPGRFHLGSALDLPFTEGAFATLLSTDCLEHLAPDDVPVALADFHRVCRRALYVRLATTPDRDGRWHLTIEPRRWWETRFADAGFCRHPRALQVRSFTDLEADDWNVSMLWRRLPPAATHAAISEGDFLRRFDGEAEAAHARIAQVAETLRPNERALILGPGAVPAGLCLLELSAAAEVHAFEADPALAAPEHPYACVAGPTLRVSGHSPQCLESLEAGAADWILIDGVAVTPALLDEAGRVLVPGGRLVVALPQARAGTVTDLFSHSSALLPERGWWLQLVGADGADGPQRRLEPIPVDQTPPESGRGWLLAVAMKDPWAGTGAAYVQRSYPQLNRPEINLKAFARDYVNPWLVGAMVVWGQRATSDVLLRSMARRTLMEAGDAGGADCGAALCVQLYRCIEDADTQAREADRLLGTVNAYLRRPAANPHELRWHISLEFAAARLHQERGEPARAEALFEACSRRDAAAFSPLLGTKTVGAAFRAGWLALAREDRAAARARWTRGIETARRLCGGSWREVIGQAEDPYPWGLMELQEVLGWAQRCAQALEGLKRWERSPAVLTACADYSLAEREKVHLKELAGLREAVRASGEKARALDADLAGQLAGQRYTWQALVRAAAATRPVYLWGASECGRLALTFLGEAAEAVSGFIDRAPEKAGTRFEGLPVSSPDAALGTEPHLFVAITSVHVAAITADLEERGLRRSRDFDDLFTPVMRRHARDNAHARSSHA